MKAFLAILESVDYVVLAVLVLAITAVGSTATRQRVNLRRLERKLDAVILHLKIEMPSRLSPEVQELARDPGRRIAAIKMHREENPELSLAETKEEIEHFIKAQGRG